MNINRVAISGNLTRDAELRATSNGTNMLTFSMAVNERRRNAQSGEWEDYPNFVDCTYFGNYGAAIASSMVKGTKVVAEGRLHYSSWDAQDGSKRSKLSVTVDAIDLISAPRDNNGTNRPRFAQPQASPAAYDTPVQTTVTETTSYSLTSQPNPFEQPQQTPPAISQAAGAPPTPVVNSNASIYDDDIPF